MSRHRAWRTAVEAVVLLVAYQVYRQIRAAIQSTTRQAEIHARQVIRVERALGLFHEEAVQHPFAHTAWWLRLWDTWYGTMHYASPILGLAILHVVAPDRYRRWRNVLGFVLLLACLGFWLYPLLPPRLLPARYHFVDSGAVYGGIGPVGKDVAAGALNAYAAMPSLHLAWSTWATCALWRLVPRRWAPLLLLWPAAMVYAVTVTANHYFLDCAGGAAAVAVAVGLERLRVAAFAGRVRVRPATGGW